MKIRLWFCVLVCCGAAGGFTEKKVDLGQNVTLECQVSVNNVYWFLMKPSEPPVYILRSFSSKGQTPRYSNPTFSKTFSLQTNSRLFIHNISTNELGVYYCIHTVSPPNISTGIRLYIQNHSAEENEEKSHQECKETILLSILITSVIINCALAIFFAVCVCRKTPKTQVQPQDPGLQHHQHSTNVLYAEVQFPLSDAPVRTNNLDSTYALVQRARH